MDGKNLPELFSLLREFEMVKESYENNKHNKTNQRTQLCVITRQVLVSGVMAPIDHNVPSHHVANHRVPGNKLPVDHNVNGVNGGRSVHAESVAVDSSVHGGRSDRAESQFQNDMGNSQHSELTDDNRLLSQPRNAQEIRNRPTVVMNRNELSRAASTPGALLSWEASSRVTAVDFLQPSRTPTA